MKKIVILVVLVGLSHLVAWGQKKYEMVIEKTDGTSVVIKTEDVVRTYFREISSGTDNPQKDFDLVGIWCYGVSEADALDNKETIEGYVFRADGTCTAFAFYNQLRNKSKMEGTYTYEDGILVITLETAYKWKNNQWERENFNIRTWRYNASISGNCMTWTGDDDETLYTRNGFTIDLGGEDNGSAVDNPTSDPEGTVSIECKANTYLYLFENVKIYCDKNVFETHSPYIDMVDYGEVRGLGDVNTIPASGWVKTVTQRVGHGYVFRYLNSNTNTFAYARAYIIGQGSGNQSMTYQLKFQSPFIPEGTDVIPNGTYGQVVSNPNDYYNFFVNGSYISWSHVLNGEYDSQTEIYEKVLPGIDYIYTIKGNEITLASPVGSTTLYYKRAEGAFTIGDKTFVKLQQIVDVVKH